MTAGDPSPSPRLSQDFPALAESLRGVERAAATDAPVLLLGEPGAAAPPWPAPSTAPARGAAGPLVEVDPGAIPSTLFESEFFGYRAGAFTGAERAGEGRVARAEGGTLRARPRRGAAAGGPAQAAAPGGRAAVRPSGRRGGRSADVRFVAIGSEDLPRRVARETFRPDLFYRLEVLAFRLPPAARAPRGPPAVLDHLLADLAERFGRRGLALAPRARAWMLEHPWPGNLRQLRNMLERGLILRARGPARRSAAAGRLDRRAAAVRSWRWRRSRSATPSPTPAATRGGPRSSWASAGRRCGRSGGGTGFRSWLEARDARRGARGCPGGLACCRSRASLPGDVVTQRRWRKPFPAMLPALVVSEALRRPDGGGPRRLVVTDWAVSTKPPWPATRGSRGRPDLARSRISTALP